MRVKINDRWFEVGVGRTKRIVVEMTKDDQGYVEEYGDMIIFDQNMDTIVPVELISEIEEMKTDKNTPKIKPSGEGATI